jgi:hypothetical protein
MLSAVAVEIEMPPRTMEKTRMERNPGIEKERQRGKRDFMRASW